jgi:HK97 gp10 family phage protein
MPTAKKGVKVEGLRELRKEIRALGDKDLNRSLNKANKAAADVVRDEAKTSTRMPRKSGKLAGSVKSGASGDRATVSAGSAVKVPYAGAIHFGWPKRGIRPRPFLYAAMATKRDEVLAAYEKAMDDLARKLSS